MGHNVDSRSFKKFFVKAADAWEHFIWSENMWSEESPHSSERSALNSHDETLDIKPIDNLNYASASTTGSLLEQLQQTTGREDLGLEELSIIATTDNVNISDLPESIPSHENFQQIGYQDDSNDQGISNIKFSDDTNSLHVPHASYILEGQQISNPERSPDSPNQYPDCESIYDAHPLDRLDATRMLKILPATTTDMTDVISCRLEVVSLNSTPEYRALSYVWGPASDTKTILVDGKSVNVQTNLWHFLSQARSDGYVDLLWIDAICINQDDMDERRIQVAIMGQIYSKASQVRAWLGVGSEETFLAMQCFADQGWSTELIRKQNGWPSSMTNEEMMRIQDFFTLEYWTRQWVLQECILAQCIVFQCGPELLHWGATFGKMLWRVDLTIESTIPAYRMIIARQFYRLVEKPEFSGMYFALVLQLSSKSLCTDLHDHVYALLSLIEDVSLEIVADYSKPLLQLFLEVVAWFESKLESANTDLSKPFLDAAVVLQGKLNLSTCSEATKAREKLTNKTKCQHCSSEKA